MSETQFKERRKVSRASLDLFVVIFCLCGIAVSLFLFQRELFMTFKSSANEPAGTVEVRRNTVQRRMIDRVVWDRLYNESQLFNGDLVRIAKQSGVTLNLDNNLVELGENTLVRIQKDADGRSILQIDFYSGDIRVVSGRDSGAMQLAIGDRIVETSPNSVFSASHGDNGMVLRVTDGSASIEKDGQKQEAQAGTVITIDFRNNEIYIPEIRQYEELQQTEQQINRAEPEPEYEPEPPPQPALQPMLATPSNLLPAIDSRIGAEQLRQNMNITFSWSRVSGANAYALIVYRQLNQRRQQILRTETRDRTSFSLEDLSILDNGTYFWTVEALSYDASNRITRRSRLAESSFLLDIPLPGRAQPREMGVLYGTE